MYGNMYTTKEIQHSTKVNKQYKKGETNMTTYIIYVNGYEIGRADLTESEVKAYNTLEGVAVTKA